MIEPLNVTATFFRVGNFQKGRWISLNGIVSAVSTNQGNKLILGMFDGSKITLEGDDAFQVKYALNCCSINDCLPAEQDFKCYDEDIPSREEVEEDEVSRIYREIANS